MSTYSINIGTITETTSLDNLNDVLNQLPDNTSHLVSPKDVRDAVYTTWTNNVLKPTTITASSVEYIGFDSSETGLTIRDKFFLGKRNLQGKDIMSDALLNSDTDLYLFNTKIDSGSQDTKISILAGTNSSLYSLSPYLESSYVIGTSSYLDFNIKNPSGNINISSSNKNISINGIIFPTQVETGSASNGYVLKYLNIASQSYVKWSPVGSIDIDTIYSSGTVSITGNPVVINGYDVTFTNYNPTIVPIGGIGIGETFSVPIVNVLNKMIYPYISASVSIGLSVTSGISNGITGSGTNNVLAEPSSLSNIKYTYNIVKKSYPILSILSSPGGSEPPTPIRLSGTSSISIPSSTQVYTIQATDGTQSVTATASLTYTYPYFWGVTTSNINFSSSGSLNGLTKALRVKSDINAYLSGSYSHIYFLYPSSYGDISQIIDTTTGWNYISSFTKIHNAISLTSSSPYWTNTYNVYSYTAGGGLTTVNSMWTFKH